MNRSPSILLFEPGEKFRFQAIEGDIIPPLPLFFDRAAREGFIKRRHRDMLFASSNLEDMPGKMGLCSVPEVER